MRRVSASDHASPLRRSTQSRRKRSPSVFAASTISSTMSASRWEYETKARAYRKLARSVLHDLVVRGHLLAQHPRRLSFDFGDRIRSAGRAAARMGEDEKRVQALGDDLARPVDGELAVLSEGRGRA